MRPPTWAALAAVLFSRSLSPLCAHLYWPQLREQHLHLQGFHLLSLHKCAPQEGEKHHQGNPKEGEMKLGISPVLGPKSSQARTGDT